MALEDTALRLIRKFGEEFERDLSDFKPGLYIFTTVDEDGERAVATATETLSRQYAQDFSQLVHKYALAGDPDACKARLREYTDAGARVVILSPCCPDDEVNGNLRNIANDVIADF